MPTHDEKPIDQRTTLEKLSKGDVGAFDAGDVAGAAGTTIGVVAPVLGKVVPGADGLAAAFTGISDHVAGSKEIAAISRRFGNTRRLRSPKVRAQLRHIEDRWQGSVMESLASWGGGAAVGAAAAAFIASPTFIGVPIAAIAGSIVGGFGGSYLYRKACTTQAQDPLTINEQICKMRDAGEVVPKELIAAALAANLSGKDGKYADKALKRLTGTKIFSEALGNEKNIPKLAAMMNDQRLRTSIRAATALPRDPMSPEKSTVDQYYELINSGALDPAKMLNKSDVLLAFQQLNAQKMSAQQQPAAEVPMTPAIERSRERTV